MNSFSLKPKENPQPRIALTLVELLVALTILTLVSALIVPRLRIINKERNIREAARVAASMFSAARDRALRDGAAGVIIERNLNFVNTTSSGNEVYYAGSRLYELRTLPEYTGDAATDFALVVYTQDINGNDVLRCYIPQPLEHDPLNNQFMVRLGDQISIQGTRFQIRNVLDVAEVNFTGNILVGRPPMVNGQNVGSPYFMLPLELEFDNDQIPDNDLILGETDFVTNRGLGQILFNGFDSNDDPVPFPFGNNTFRLNAADARAYGDFSILRMRKRESSVVNMPAGYLIDLRYSGPLDPDGFVPGGLDTDEETATIFGLGLAAGTDPSVPIHRDIQVLFDSKGALDRAIFNGNSTLAGQSLFLFVNEFNPLVTGNAASVAETLLSEPDSLWLTIGFNGGVNIGYNATPPSDTIASMISNARTLSRNRTSASQ